MVSLFLFDLVDVRQQCRRKMRPLLYLFAVIVRSKGSSASFPRRVDLCLLSSHCLAITAQSERERNSLMSRVFPVRQGLLPI